jgi:hypothetical protein
MLGAKRDEILWKAHNGMLDVLITSFNTIASDFRQFAEEEGRPRPAVTNKKQRKTPWIFDVEFHRIVLDEAHIVSYAIV